MSCCTDETSPSTDRYMTLFAPAGGKGTVTSFFSREENTLYPSTATESTVYVSMERSPLAFLKRKLDVMTSNLESQCLGKQRQDDL